jgi:hypothetical protein
MIPETLSTLLGVWSGTKRVWMAPDAPVHESPATATVSHAAKGHFLSIHYSWAHEGAPQEGLLLIGASQAQAPGPPCGGEPQSSPGNNVHVQAVWADSWHMGHSLMLATGTLSDSGVTVTGSYAAPPGPEWGWRIDVLAESDRRWRLTMYNIPPGAQESLAVDVAFEK